MRLFAEANYPFLEWRRRAFAVSGIAIALGIVAMIINTATLGSWLNYGVDFAGGTLVEVRFHERVDVDAVRAVGPGWQITRFGEADASDYVIRVPVFEDRLDVDPREQVAGQLEAAFGADAFDVVRTEAVGPRVGDQLQQRALLAILISFALTLVYLAFRFEWRFGIAAIISSGHDIILTLGIVAALQMEISITSVAAFLTVLGYSLNDTIVIFDRIRENLLKRRRDETNESIIDRSINETLPRTIITSLTTLATLVPLYLFGGAVIQDFALVLILGIAIGTFSSIFVAAPALHAIETKWPRSTKNKGRGGSARQRQAASL